MKKRLLSLLSVVVMITLLSTPVSAEGGVKFRSATFSLGSLIANGTLIGLGGYNEGVTVELTARGTPVVTCINHGYNQSPGQNPPNISASGQDYIAPLEITEKGKALVGVETEPIQITGTEGGCPNDNWTAQIDFVYWTRATIDVIDNMNGAILLTQNYDCVTTRDPDTVSCTPAP